MKNKIYNASAGLLLFTTCSIIAACVQKPVNEVDGYVPIYNSLSALKKIEALAPIPTKVAGKIFQYGSSRTLQVDAGSGVHIINCSDPKNPFKEKFISIPGATEVVVKNNILISNNGNDLVSINITDLNNVQLLSRLENVYTTPIASTPPESNVYFECPDESKGVIIGWEKKKIKNPKCKTL